MNDLQTGNFPMIFDQYSRYQACADILRHIFSLENARLLDVGSGQGCLLGQFIPEAEITFQDQQFSEDDTPSSRCLAGDILQLELEDNAFDFVVSVDTLEHIPQTQRSSFLAKLSAVASRGLVIGFPSSDDDGAGETDRFVDTIYRHHFGTSYPWLDEHFRFSLPSARAVENQLRELGWNCLTVGHGHVPWLKELLALTICLWEIPEGRDLVMEMSAAFNQTLYPYDFRPPCYRTFVIAIPDGTVVEPPSFPVVHPGDVVERYNRLVAKYREQMLGLCVSVHLNRNSLLGEKEDLVQQRQAAVQELEATRGRCIALSSELEAVYQSRSWRVTRPLRFLGGLVLRGRRFVAGRGRSVFDRLRSCYHRMPLPLPVRRTISAGFHRAVRYIRPLLTRRTQDTDFVPPVWQPAPPAGNGPDYIVWGVINWHFRLQRPQHIARSLNGYGRRVFYVSVHMVDDPRPGFAIEPLDDSGRLFEIRLHASGAPVIYHAAPDDSTVRQLRQSLGELLLWAGIHAPVSLVQHPFWTDIASSVPDSRLVYDCMDFHEGFGNTAEAVLKLERKLLGLADMTVVTSNWLDEAVRPLVRSRVLIRNACDFDHFAEKPEKIYRDGQGRPVIGYFGAIAEWFDVELVEEIARCFPHCSILLLGADTAGARSRLQKRDNITMKGEVPFDDLPYYLYGFDVCLLPFRVLPLTMATNPVKVYEYLCAGKPVVAVDLPEMTQFAGLVRVADDRAGFLAAVEDALRHPGTPDEIRARRDFARRQTWRSRVADLVAHVERDDGDPLVSVIIVTYNNLDLTRRCLESLAAHTGYPRMEIIVVDNCSGDGTAEFLRQWAQESSSTRKIVLNTENRGFAAANNQGLAMAQGEFLVLLNNDTYVTPGWLRTLMNHLRRDSSIGIIGPVTNNIGNEAKIDISYSTMDEMLAASRRYVCSHLGELLELRTVAFFCAMFPRSVYETVGELDEAFGLGFFEDDDYCRRIEEAGLRIVCAEDAFIHHHLSASFDKVKANKRKELFERNKEIYEKKWGVWKPHTYRRQVVPEQNASHGAGGQDVVA